MDCQVRVREELLQKFHGEGVEQLFELRQGGEKGCPVSHKVKL